MKAALTITPLNERLFSPEEPLVYDARFEPLRAFREPGELVVTNCWDFKYLGSIFEDGGGQMCDVKRRIVMARQRFDKLRHLWQNKDLHLQL